MTVSWSVSITTDALLALVVFRYVITGVRLLTMPQQQVQADEIKVKEGGYLWLAMAIMVPTRLWLGGIISPRRDKVLIQALANPIRALALCRALLLAVDGLPGNTQAF